MHDNVCKAVVDCAFVQGPDHQKLYWPGQGPYIMSSRNYCLVRFSHFALSKVVLALCPMTKTMDVHWRFHLLNLHCPFYFFYQGTSRSLTYFSHRRKTRVVSE